jgi:hypothetical protein
VPACDVRSSAGRTSASLISHRLRLRRALLSLVPAAGPQASLGDLVDTLAGQDLLRWPSRLRLVRRDLQVSGGHRPFRPASADTPGAGRAGDPRCARCSSPRPACPQPTRRTWSGAWPTGTGFPMLCAAPAPSRAKVRPQPPSPTASSLTDADARNAAEACVRSGPVQLPRQTRDGQGDSALERSPVTNVCPGRPGRRLGPGRRWVCGHSSSRCG